MCLRSLFFADLCLCTLVSVVSVGGVHVFETTAKRLFANNSQGRLGGFNSIVGGTRGENKSNMEVNY